MRSARCLLEEEVVVPLLAVHAHERKVGIEHLAAAVERLNDDAPAAGGQHCRHAALGAVHCAEQLGEVLSVDLILLRLCAKRTVAPGALEPNALARGVGLLVGRDLHLRFLRVEDVHARSTHVVGIVGHADGSSRKTALPSASR